ncbi:hypothetical protein HRbin01_00452 [archaeon HR01]|nr:hypothetical protein HRbin01_00452 [archaeon HR01]
MDEVSDFLAAARRAESNPSEENILAMVAGLSPFSPPGLEWGIELSSVAGSSYILEDGRLLLVRVSRDEFGPFMQTSVSQIGLESLPPQVLKSLADVKVFLGKVSSHLKLWLERAPKDHPKIDLIQRLVQALEEDFLNQKI